MFCFGRARHKNFRSRQAQKFPSAVIFASFAPVPKIFRRDRRKNALVGGLSCFSHLSCKKCGPQTILLWSNQAKKFRSVFIFTSFAPVVKVFGRTRRENNSVGGYLCFGRASWKVVRSAFIFASFAPVAKTFGRARRRKKSVDGHMYFARASPKKLPLAGTFISVAPVAKTFSRAGHKKNRSAVLSNSLAPVKIT